MANREKPHNAHFYAYLAFKMRLMEVLVLRGLTSKLMGENATLESVDVLQHPARYELSTLQAVEMTWLAALFDKSKKATDLFKLFRNIGFKTEKEIAVLEKRWEPVLRSLRDFRNEAGAHSTSDIRKIIDARRKVTVTNVAAFHEFLNDLTKVRDELFQEQEELFPDFHGRVRQFLIQNHLDERSVPAQMLLC